MAWVAPVMAVVVVLFLLGITYSLLGKLDLPDSEWTRAVYLLSGIEAVAFAGAGFLFGKEVNRARAENAEENAEEAKKREVESNEQKKAAENKLNQAKNNIDAFKTVINSKKNANAIRNGLEGVGGSKVSPEKLQSDLYELADLADKLFPN